MNDPAAAIRDAKVLVVDDTPANIDLLRSMLEPQGCRLAFATSGEQALRIAAAFAPDLVLLDVMMPGLDGFETCVRLKAMAALQDVPVIFVTAKTEPEDLARAYRVGGVDYITKPVRRAEVCARVANHLRIRSLIREHETTLAELRALTRRLHRSEQRFKDIAESASDWFWEMDAELRFSYFSRRFFETTGLEAAAVLGKTRAELTTPEQLAQEPEKWRRHLEDLAQHRPFRDFEYTLVAADGRKTHICISGKPVFDDDGTFLGYRGASSDVTAQRQAEEELRRLATTDSLTGACNRRYFLETADKEFARARRYRHPLSALMLDADHFKRINDTYGHDVGDRVLEALAGLCREQLREQDVFGRLGGEEFAAALPETEHEGAREVGERLRRAIDEATVADGQVRFTISVGVATATDRDGDFSALLKRADEALYEAKESGRNRVVTRSQLDQPQVEQEHDHHAQRSDVADRKVP